VKDGEKLPKPGGLESYLQAKRESEGEEYFITHIDLESLDYQLKLIVYDAEKEVIAKWQN